MSSGGESGLPQKVAWHSCVTTSRQARPEDEEEARALAEGMGVPFEPRARSIEGWIASGAYDAVMVVNREHLALWVGRAAGREGVRPERLFFHPSTSVQRVKALLNGGTDPMIEALELEPGMRLLDATLGVGSDAIVSSFVAGPEGKVVGLESVRELAVLARQGMKTYQGPTQPVEAAMRRIEVVHADHAAFLAGTPSGSFDAVYLDPMFRAPVSQSSAIAPWRLLADHRPIGPEVIAEARRVARRRVVLKERKGSPIFEELAAQRVANRRSGRIAYGIWEAFS